MKGTISNFRMARHHQKGSQMIVLPEGSSGMEDAKKVIGKSVSWKSPAGKEIKGTVAKEHGRNGYVRVNFEKGMPGQAVGTPVDIN